MFQLDEGNDKSPHRILNGTITINTIIIIIIIASADINFFAAASCCTVIRSKQLLRLCSGQSIFPPRTRQLKMPTR